MNFLAATEHLPRLVGAGPVVLVAEGVVDPSPIASAALEVWIAAPRGDGLLLHPLGTRAPDIAATVEAEAPRGLLALVVPDAAMVGRLREWWTGVTGRAAPPVLAAASGAAALPALLAVVAEALAASVLREAAALRAVPPGAARPEDDATVPASVPDPSDPVANSGSALRAGPDPVPDWAMLHVLDGDADLVALGDEPARPLLRARARSMAILAVPVSMASAPPDASALTIVLANGSGEGASVAAWLRPAGETPRDLTDLSPDRPGSAWTGWRDLTGEPLELTLPAAPKGAGAWLAIGLRAGDVVAIAEVQAVAPSVRPPVAASPWPLLPVGAGTGEGAAAPPEAEPAAPTPPGPRASVPEGELFASGPRQLPAPSAPERTSVPPQPLPPAPPPPDLPPLAAAPADSPAAAASAVRHGALRLHDHEETGAYRHIDIEIDGLEDGTRRWDVIRLKFAIEEEEPRLEFRLASGWPQVFEAWLGRQSDRFGPFLRVFESDIREFLEMVEDPRDAALMEALLPALPALVEEGCALAGLPANDIPAWVAAARALRSEAARRP